MIKKYKKSEFYVVWNGRSTGIFKGWNQCEVSVKDFKNAKYRGFKTHQEADEAFKMGYVAYKEKLWKDVEEIFSQFD